jgi:hypothetical protein
MPRVSRKASRRFTRRQCGTPPQSRQTPFSTSRVPVCPTPAREIRSRPRPASVRAIWNALRQSCSILPIGLRASAATDPRPSRLPAKSVITAVIRSRSISIPATCASAGFTSSRVGRRPRGAHVALVSRINFLASSTPADREIVAALTSNTQRQFRAHRLTPVEDLPKQQFFKLSHSRIVRRRGVKA